MKAGRYPVGSVVRIKAEAFMSRARANPNIAASLLHDLPSHGDLSYSSMRNGTLGAILGAAHHTHNIEHELVYLNTKNTHILLVRYYLR